MSLRSSADTRMIEVDRYRWRQQHPVFVPHAHSLSRYSPSTLGDWPHMWQRMAPKSVSTGQSAVGEGILAQWSRVRAWNSSVCWARCPAWCSVPEEIFSVEGISPVVLTWVLTPFPPKKNSLGWEYKLRSSLCIHARTQKILTFMS